MSLLEIVEAAISQDPGLMSLSVIRKALRGLIEGENAMTVVEWISTDLDKIGHGKSHEFGQYLMNAHKCVDAYRRIHSVNQAANDGQGLRAVRDMLSSLERFDLEDARAIFQNDGDKIRQYKSLYKTIETTVIGCREHGITYYCTRCFKS